MEKVSKTDVILDFTLPMGGNPEDFVTPPMAIYQPEPAYNNSKQTKAAKSQGMVRLDVMVTADGTVSDVKVTKSLDKMLDENAVQTVKTWKFLPALKAGKPVPFKTNVAISFRLF
jgi:protein TonB